MEGRVRAPPACPGLCTPWAGPAAEHVSPHDQRPDATIVFFQDARARARLPRPGVQRPPADAERMLTALIGARSEAVERDRSGVAELAHGSSPTQTAAGTGSHRSGSGVHLTAVERRRVGDADDQLLR